MFLQEMSGVTTKALVHAKVEGPTKGLCAPRQPLMHSAIHFCSHSTNIVLHIRVHLIVFLPETQDTTEWPSSRMILGLPVSIVLDTTNLKKGPSTQCLTWVLQQDCVLLLKFEKGKFCEYKIETTSKRRS